MEPLILLTGATGYIGRRLLGVLQRSGRKLRCLARRPEALEGDNAGRMEAVAGDILKQETLKPALEGVDTAYYLVHSLGAGAAFEQQDRQAAENFGRAAAAAAVRRIVYLGGLGNAEEDLSSHLRSRQEVGNVLRESGVAVLEFRASIVIGSGSLSFEIIRALVERLPVMIAPRWVSTLAQPIAVEDVISYLAAAADLPHGPGRVFEIGGSQQLSYGELMQEYARQRQLRRVIIPVPVLTPRLSSLWLTLVTPVHARVGRLLIEGLKNPTLVRDHSALEQFPIRPMSAAQAIHRALQNEDQEFAETRWSDAVSAGTASSSFGGATVGSRIVDVREVQVSRPPAAAFRAIRRLGGDTGWYYGDLWWRLRGLIDSLGGGVGLRRGRRHPDHLRLGDTLDFWRVEAIEPDRRLRLAAEMRLPGRAWLEFEVTKNEAGSSIRQAAIFDPVGLAGRMYWYGLYPLHWMIFRGMLRGIAKAVETGRT